MNQQIVNVYNLPNQVVARDLASSAVIVIDILRATSTICTALAAGATEVKPFVEIDQALAAALKIGRDRVVLGGEREGLLIPGFDLGNSPAEYTRQSVGGRRILITTTNGTRALRRARYAGRVIIASFLNLSAVVASIKDEPRIDILCAGTDGKETLEDVLCAGAIVERLHTPDGERSQLNERAEAAAREWRILAGKAELTGNPLATQLAFKFRDTLGGRNCIEVGNEADLPLCARIDELDVVPEYDLQNGRITVSSTQSSP